MQTWKSVYNGDDSVVGSTFWVNTNAVTVAGIKPERFSGDCMSSTPPDFYLPIESMVDAGGSAKYVHDPEQKWLDIIGRVKPGTALGPLQEKLSARLKQVHSASPEPFLCATRTARGYAFGADAAWCGYAGDAVSTLRQT